MHCVCALGWGWGCGDVGVARICFRLVAGIGVFARKVIGMRHIEWSASKDFTSEGFRTWVLAQPKASIIGLVAVAARCPLACWITDVSGKSCVIGISSYRCPAWYTPRPLPEWAWQFALFLDHAYLTDAHLRVAIGRPVKREQVLQVLEQVG